MTKTQKVTVIVLYVPVSKVQSLNSLFFSVLHYLYFSEEIGDDQDKDHEDLLVELKVAVL